MFALCFRDIYIYIYIIRNIYAKILYFAKDPRSDPKLPRLIAASSESTGSPGCLIRCRAEFRRFQRIFFNGQIQCLFSTIPIKAVELYESEAVLIEIVRSFLSCGAKIVEK